MKISNSKKQLARLLIEAGVTKFPKGAYWAAQGRIDLKASFYGGYKPKRGYGETAFCGNYCGSHHDVQLPTPIPNWHQTVLSRDEFDQIVAETVVHGEPYSDGWIEWSGGECQVGEDQLVRIKVSGETGTARGKAGHWSWGHSGCGSDIIAYMVHNPEQAKPRFCESVMRSIPEYEIHSKNMDITQVDDINVVELKPTIEQLAADYSSAKDCADRKQQEADDAKADADAKPAELVAAGKALNLVISVAEEEPELVITDWRDLLVGDEVEYLGGSLDYMIGEVGTVCEFDELHKHSPVRIESRRLKGAHQAWPGKWRFIRRP